MKNGVKGNKKAQITCVANNKGGVGKTTTAVNLACALQALANKVLLVDLDPQGNCAYGLGIEPYEDVYTIGDVFAGTCGLGDAIIRTKYVDIIPNNLYTYKKVSPNTAHSRLSEIFSNNPNIMEYYDHIIIDTPPSIETMTLNAALASDVFLLVTEYSKFSMIGIKILMEVLDDFGGVDVKNKLRTMPKPILFTMYDSRIRLNKLVEKNISESNTGVILAEKITRTVKVQESFFEGVPAVMRANNPAGKGYKELAIQWDIAKKTGILHGKTQTIRIL
jgi:chromosome partitioning protein